MKSKKIGNQFENKIAKVLSEWIFDDSTSIIRSITSGALKNDKSKYNGDLIPVGNEIYKKFIYFPFLIECKKGYNDHLPTFFNSQNIIKKWFDKCVEETTDTQKIILLICEFNGYPPLVFTNYKFTTDPKLAIFHNANKKEVMIYCYPLSQLITYTVDSLINDRTIFKSI